MAEVDKARLEDRRPMSPHLQIYRPSLTMAMSMAHRISGACLYAGSALIACYFISAAISERAFDGIYRCFASPIGLIILFFYSWALFHHMLGGLRHAIWDQGLGMDHAGREFLARASLVGGFGLTVLVWLIALLA